jgi:ABC-type multidrug transport system ATPase subunit
MSDDVVLADPMPPPPSVVHFATPPGQALLTIGRADADIVLDQPVVSRRHADLAWEHDRHVLYDRDSHHGTFVNGVRVEGARVLAPGDVVQIGAFKLTYDGDSLDSFDQRKAIRLDATALRRTVPGKILLDDTTLSIEPCELVAIVGESGAGKSTLMMALCGFRPADAGKVAINGDDLYAAMAAYRSIVGYVPQDDTLHRSLPVARALRYAARLRLPPDTSAHEIEARIDRVLEQVEMTAHRDQRIDQLSGGQRKRVSIACELLADPVLLFLDEPTSGLDPGLERKLMMTLRKLANDGRTIILVTHATANIKQCDHIAFMAGGRMVYFGPPSQAPEFFAVSDFADIYSCCEAAADPTAAKRWHDKFAHSLQFQKYVIERPARAPAHPSMEQQTETAARARRFQASGWHQLRVLVRRYFDLMLADRKNLALLLLQAPVIGVLLLLVSGRFSLESGRIDAKKLLFMLSTTGVWFGVINSAREICKEAPVLARERLAGLRTGPYLLSKLVVLFTLVLVQSALLLGTIALRVELPQTGVILPAPLELFVTIVLTGCAGLALGLCLSALASTPDKATSLIPIVLVPQVVFAGVMFALHGVTEWISYAVSSRAAMEALGTSADLNALSESILGLHLEPEFVHTSHHLLSLWGTLGAQAAAFSLIAWLALRRH